MVTRRTAKSKGASHEKDVLESIQARFPDSYLTHHIGFVQQYDIRNDINNFVIECKRHAKFSWNELVKLLEKLKSVAPEGYECWLTFKPNRQPCLVMYDTGDHHYVIEEFDKFFNVPFIKHTPIKRK